MTAMVGKRAFVAHSIKTRDAPGWNENGGATAKRLGIDDIEAEVLPDQKSAIVSKLKKEGRVDYDKLRKEGYSDRFLAKVEAA